LSKNNGEQRDFIAAEISRLTASGVPLNEIAILGRTYHTLLNLGYALNRQGITIVESYNIVGDYSYTILKSTLEIVKWYSTKKGKTNPPVEAITNIVGLLDQPDEKQQKLINSIISSPRQSKSFRKSGSKSGGKNSNTGWNAFKILGKENHTLSRKVSTFRKKVIQVAQNKFPIKKSLLILCDALKPLINATFNQKLKPSVIVDRDFSAITTALSSYTNWDDAIKNFPTFNADTDNSIELTTCHAAKGREWKYVFLINFVQGYFPYFNNKNEEKIEDERNLFYVAITRASKQLTVIESPYLYNVNGESRKRVNRSVFVSNYESEFETYPVSTEMTS
jgi:superfamily I DNA/RNA helicase